MVKKKKKIPDMDVSVYVFLFHKDKLYLSGFVFPSLCFPFCLI